MAFLALIGGAVLCGLCALGLYHYLTTTTFPGKPRKRRN